MSTNKKRGPALAPPKIIYQPILKIPAIGQCDACSPIVFAENKFPQPTISNVPYHLNPTLIKQVIDSTAYAVLSPFTEMFSVLNRSAAICLQYFKSPKPFESIPAKWSNIWGKSAIKSLLAKMIKIGLLVPEDYVTSISTEVPETLAAWIHITDRCNLRCVYCYLAHTPADMSLEVGRAAIESTFRSAIAHNYQKIKFKYAGGEPLLRFPLVKELHQFAKYSAEQHGLSVDGVVLTNATLLTSETIREMQSLDLRLTVSLDNLANFDAAQRVYSGGRDSSNDAIRNIELALNYGLVPDISITVSGKNVKGLPELIAWVLERDLPFSLNFYRANDFSSSCVDLKLEEEKIISGMLNVYKVIEANLPEHSLLASLVDRAMPSTAHLRPCSVGHSYVVFDPLGQVAKCQMEINKPVTNLFVNDPLKLIRQDRDGIQNESVEDKESCHSCDWKYLCAGGCPLDTFRTTGKYNGKFPHCNTYKTLLPEVVRLEALRLLKAHV